VKIGVNPWLLRERNSIACLPGERNFHLEQERKPRQGFASYQSNAEVEGTKIRYWREYIVRDLSVNADHIADWRKLQGVIDSDEAAAVVLKHNP
jgi:hypothetical protein